MRWCLRLTLFLVLCVDAFAASIKIDNSQDYNVLNKFFRTMFTHSEYGYVLDGSKPVSQMNVFSTGDLIAPQSLNFQIATCAREVIKLWDRICPEQTDFVLKATEIQDQRIDFPIHELVFINVPKLRAEIEANINLFRYVLGPTIDPEKLVDHIVQSKDSLNSILRGDKVLTGIVLGFGAYNSLMHSRAEEIQNALLVRDVPPFASRANLMEQKEVVRREGERLKMHFLSCSGAACFEVDEKLFVVPGLGFSNLEEELDAISSYRDNTPQLFTRENPRFVFGAYKHVNNQQLTAGLAKSQKRIKQLLQRPDFLEIVLSKITDEPPVISCDTSPSRLELNEKAEEAVARAVWQVGSQLDAETVPEFIEAFCRCEPSGIERGVIHSMPGALDGLRRARTNLRFAEAWFATQPKEKNLKEIMPGYLYFEQIKAGEGKMVGTSDRLLISYAIEDGYGNMLSANYNCWLKLSTTIPSFAHAVQGMREGETRMIYIHPSLAYGASATLPPCVSLAAKVSVHQVVQHSQCCLPALSPVDLSWVKEIKFYQEVEKASYSLARSLGSRWGVWLNKNPDIDFSKICMHLKDLAASNKLSAGLKQRPSDEKRSICNRVFWNLISSDSED